MPNYEFYDACLFSGWLRMQCFGHRLHLAVQTILKDQNIKDSLSTMHKIIGHFNHSHKKIKLLKEAQVFDYLIL